ncbi:MAG TPA: phenylalanine--tRNA ligase subunit beta [Fluviicoccus sp.]|nr:phenylalanine--tRNA ligase subunit beta [Fluviicoccus sp.]
MQISEQWLREWVNPSLNAQQLGHQMTMAGLEVDALKPVAPAFNNVLVGEVLSAEPHPQADRLRVTKVSIGSGEPLQIVCGAANVRAGLKVCVATFGAKLPGGFEIGKAKLRGVESFGMLCAAQELGLEPPTEGLLELPADAPVGANLRDYLNLDDNLIELGITPNRGDCLSIAGMAREVATFNRLSVCVPEILPVAAQSADAPLVKLDSTDCPRYLGRIIRGINPAAATPEWMARRLERGGIRPLSLVVDVTNYVLLELGQPMHAFDLAKIDGGIVVRKAKAGEALALLNGQTVELRDDTLVIADHAKALAMAGIMGGNDSAVTDATTDILLESAFFQPLAVAGKARSYGLHTDSSHRFERGVDFALQRQAIERATALIVAAAGGVPGEVVEAVQADSLPVRAPIRLRPARVEKVLGFGMVAADIEDILTRLGMVLQADGEGWLVTPPSWRFDMSIEADLIEELARVHGYDNLPTRAPRNSVMLAPRAEARTIAELQDFLVGQGYQEAITFSFVDPKIQEILDPGQAVLPLANPLSSELSVMRTTLWAGLLNAVAWNQNRQQPRVRLFEVGSRFIPQADGSLHQEAMLAGVITDSLLPEGWANGKAKTDFFDIKANVEGILALTATSDRVEFKAGYHPALHPGQSAEIVDNAGKVIGRVGKLHPQVQQRLDLQGAVFVFELSLEPLLQAHVPAFRELSRFPGVRRDLAIVLDAAIESAEVLKTVRAAAGELLQDVWLFDVYQGAGIPDGKRSLAIGTQWQHNDRTLQDDEVKSGVQAVLSALEQTFNAVLR